VVLGCKMRRGRAKRRETDAPAEGLSRYSPHLNNERTVCEGEGNGMWKCVMPCKSQRGPGVTMQQPAVGCIRQRGVLLLNCGLDTCIELVVRRVQRCERLTAGQADLPELLYASTGGAQVNSGYTARQGAGNKLEYVT